MSLTEKDTLTIRDCKLVFQNFKGEAKKYNAAGKRNFSVILDPTNAAAMKEDGWNVKKTRDREVDGEEIFGDYYLHVEVGFNFKAPNITMITTNNRTRIGEDLVSMLDDAEIIKCDIVLRPYFWEVNGNTGVKAYLKTMFVTVREDELEAEYALGD